MSGISLAPTRRSFLATSAAAGAFSLLPAHLAAAAAAGDARPSQPSNQGDSPMGTTDDNAIRPFRIKVPEEALVDLRRRIAATRWPDREPVTDQSPAAHLPKIHPPQLSFPPHYD